MENWDKTVKWWVDSQKAAVFAAVPEGYGTVVREDGAYKLTRPDGSSVTAEYGLATSNSLDGLMRSMAATSELMGDYYNKTIGSVNTRINQLGLTRGVTKETFDTYFESLIKTYDPNQISGLIHWENATDMHEQWLGPRLLQDWDARRVIWENMQQALKPIQEAVNAYMTEYAAGKLTEGTLAKYMTCTNVGNEVGAAMQLFKYRLVQNVWLQQWNFPRHERVQRPDEDVRVCHSRRNGQNYRRQYAARHRGYQNHGIGFRPGWTGGDEQC